MATVYILLPAVVVTWQRPSHPAARQLVPASAVEGPFALCDKSPHHYTRKLGGPVYAVAAAQRSITGMTFDSLPLWRHFPLQALHQVQGSNLYIIIDEAGG